MAWPAGDLGIPLDSQVPSAKAATQPYWVDRENGSKQRLPESWPPAVRARIRRTMTAQICFILSSLVFHKGRTTSSRNQHKNGNVSSACLPAKLFSWVQLFVTLWTIVPQAPLSMGILQARILEWVAMPSSRRSS